MTQPQETPVAQSGKPKRLPVVFTPEEAMAVVEELQGIRWLMATLLYGGGLRLMECFRCGSRTSTLTGCR
jgi:hypothetical protein